MSKADAEKWNARYAEPSDSSDESPVPFLVESVDQLGSGKALVLAAGRGRNAVFLAEQGFDVTALDVSEKGLEQCQALAATRGVHLMTVTADLDDFDLGTANYDLITMLYFYQPAVFPRIRRALKDGGRFLFQTFSTKHAEVGTFGPRNPAFLASRETILSAFQNDTIEICNEVVLQDEEDKEAVIQLLIQTQHPA